MNQRNRDKFDQQVEWVLARLPRRILRILKEVPLHVEDQPSKRLMWVLKIDDAEELCGYFCGVPYGERKVESFDVVFHGAALPNSITIFRRGIVAEARDEWGKVSRHSLRRQIRITILHELAHLHGMSEEEIAAIGYG
jgi:predicted Zn-dependent protease with MMP-like domain